LYCRAITVSGVDPSSVMFTWVGPDGNSFANNSRILTMTSSVNISSIQFAYLMEGDNGTYTCNVMILETNGSASVVLDTLAGE